MLALTDESLARIVIGASRIARMQADDGCSGSRMWQTAAAAADTSGAVAPATAQWCRGLPA
jgi:hypothetical protein